jgi:hypothetical protein
MVRKTFGVGILVAAMMVVAVGAASAAPQAMALSSWESTVIDGNIVGGHRTVVVTNVTDAPLIGHTIDLGEAPCDCEIAAASSGQTITANTWHVSELAPGDSATLTLQYETPTLRVPAASSNSFFGSVAVITAMMLAFFGVTVMAKRPRLVLDY